MRLFSDRILDRFWLALAGSAALAMALDLGARFGHGGWAQGAVLAAAAAAHRDVPEVGSGPGRPGHACGADGTGAVR